MIPHSGIISVSMFPRLGSSSSRYTGPFLSFKIECPTSLSSFARLSNTSGKSFLIRFQYPIPPLTHPIQLLFGYPRSYIKGRAKPKVCSNNPCTSSFDKFFSMSGNSCSACGFASIVRSALSLSLRSNPQT